jgi:hypothetical protein
MRLLKKLHDVLPCCLSLLVPSTGHAKITASNCKPLRPRLQRVFFKEDHYKETAPTPGEAGDTAGAGAGQGKSEFHIAEQSTGTRQQFVFPNPLDHPQYPALTDPSAPLSGVGGAAGGVGSRALILDVPLGMRLLNSYRLGYKVRLSI